MSDEHTAALEALRRGVEELVTPHIGEVGMGNLRSKVSDWSEDSGQQTNIAVIYESPGGSTNQINITFSHETGQLTYVDQDGAEHVTDDVSQVLAEVEQHIATVPERRRKRLQWDIERWHAEGMPQSAMFAELNKMLTTDFIGGGITQAELADGTRHVMHLCKGGEPTIYQPGSSPPT